MIKYNVYTYDKEELTKNTLKNLSYKLLMIMEQNKLSMQQLSIQCDISYRGLQKIIYNEINDIKLSTLIGICENAHINYVEILNFEKIV